MQFQKIDYQNQLYYYIKYFILLVNYYVNIIILSKKFTKNINKNHMHIIIYNADYFIKKKFYYQKI